MNKKYIFFDIDVTLVAGGYGITIDNKLIDIKPLPREDMISLIDECQAKGYTWAIQTENSDIRFAPDENFYNLTHHIYMNTRIVLSLDPKNFPQIYKAYIACLYPDEFKLDSIKNSPWCRFHKEYFFVEPSYKAYGIKQIMLLPM